MYISSLEAGGTSCLGVFFPYPNNLEGPSNIRQRVPVRGSAGWFGSVKCAGRQRYGPYGSLCVWQQVVCQTHNTHVTGNALQYIFVWPMANIRGNRGTSLPHTTEKPNAATSNVTLARPVGTRRHGQFAQRFDSMTPDCLHSVCARLRIMPSVGSKQQTSNEFRWF